MSQEASGNKASTSSAASTNPEKRRSTVPEILPHQQSFEKRYSHIIHKQILETSINMEALQRQINAYFPMSRSSSVQKEGSGDGEGDQGNPTDTTGDVGKPEQSNETTSPTETRKTLEKMDTLDIAKKDGSAEGPDAAEK